jgi:hypothetical protein
MLETYVNRIVILAIFRDNFFTTEMSKNAVK